jgi:hypothetical protein
MPTKHLRTCNNLRGWSHRPQRVHHLRGCRQDPTNYLRETYPKTFGPRRRSCVIAFGEDHWTKTHMMNSIIHPSKGKDTKYKDLMKDPDLGPSFEIGLSNELGRMCQGIRAIAGANTAFFIDLKSIPKNRKITYEKLVCNFKSNKNEKHRVRLTVGGDILDSSDDTATSTADITIFKIWINITLSTQEAKMMMMDIKHNYLGTMLPTY